MALEILVNTDSGNGLVPDGTKPLLEPMLTYYQEGFVALIWGHYHKNIWRYQSVKIDNYIFKITFGSPRGQCINISDIHIPEKQEDMTRVSNKSESELLMGTEHFINGIFWPSASLFLHISWNCFWCKNVWMEFVCESDLTKTFMVNMCSYQAIKSVAFATFLGLVKHPNRISYCDQNIFGWRFSLVLPLYI